MYKHIILWVLKKDIKDKEEVKKGIKTNLEALMGKIPGMTSIKVRTDFLPTSNIDVMLDCTFTSEEALKGYGVHPDHVAAANTYVRPYTDVRLCSDYEE